MMAVEIMIARQLTYYAARQKDSGRRCDLEAGMAKLLAARVAWAAADQRGAVCTAAIGFALEFPETGHIAARHKRRKGRECDMGPTSLTARTGFTDD